MAPLSPGTEIVPLETPLRAFAANALRYWEPRRLVYNAALALVVAANAFWAGSNAWSSLPDRALMLFFLAVVANVLFCAVYAIDLFVQLAGLLPQWSWLRPTVLGIGTAFAATLAHWASVGLFTVGVD
jgi:hypothetical protein